MKRKILYSKEDSCSSNEEDDSDDDSGKVIFVTLEGTINDDKEDYVDGEVYLEAELISSLSELNKERKKNKLLKKELGELKESSGRNPEETKKVFIDLKIQLEEVKVIKDILKRRMEEKEKIHEELEA